MVTYFGFLPFLDLNLLPPNEDQDVFFLKGPSTKGTCGHTSPTTYFREAKNKKIPLIFFGKNQKKTNGGLIQPLPPHHIGLNIRYS